jgi:hypothetical protein
MEETYFRDESAALRQLVGLTRARPREPVYARLVKSSSLFAVSATFFILDQPPATSRLPASEAKGEPVDVEQFIVHSLSRLLQHLSHRTEQRKAEYVGQVRGRVAWPATYKARYSEECDPSRFVCQEVRHRYNTPENQLVKYVAGRIDACLKAIPEVIRKGLCFGQTKLQGQNGWGCRTITRLGNMEAGLNRFWRNAYMREVSLPHQIEELHQLRAERSKLNEYRTALLVYRRYVDVVLWPSEAKIKEIGRRMLPVPARPDSTAGPWLELGADILRS